MILLNGQSLRRLDVIRPEGQSLTLSERNSQSVVTAGPEAPEVAIGNWILDDEEPGAGIVWRVRTVENTLETETRRITLEHMINSLKDVSLFGEVKAADMGGSDSGCTARQALEYVLGKQGIWQLGDLCENPTKPYAFNGDTIWSAVETVTGSLDGAQWEYDFTTLPFTLHIRTCPEGFSSEMRMRRNITGMRWQVDRSRMYTRLYPIGKNNLHISGNYLSRNEDIWGRIDKVETDQSQETEAQLRAWAEARLRRHCEPTVTGTITGMELSEVTGEPLDHIVLGRRMRVPLPDWGTAVTERVTQLQWGDKIREKDKVTVTLANTEEDVASIMREMAQESARGGRTGARKAEEDHAWFEDTTEHVAMVAEAIIGKDEDGVDWSRVSKILVDGEGIHQWVRKAQGDIVAQEARIDVNEKRILQEVTDRSRGDTELSGRITVEANRITQEVTNRQNADNALSGRITVEAGKITQIVSAVGADGKVTAASIVLAINNAGESEAHIDARKVYIGSQRSTTVINGKLNASDVTATYLAAKFANTSVLSTRYAFSNTYECDTLICNDYTCAVEDAYYALQIVPDGNNYKLQGKHFYSSDWADIGTFSRAVSSASWSWVGGAPRVTLSPQGQRFTGVAINGITFSSSTKQWATDKKSFNQDFYCYDANSNTVYTENLSINTRESYEAGYAAGQSASHSIDIPTNQIYTSDSYTGTRLNTLKTKYEQAKSDGDYVMFRVDCGGTSKWYYMEP